MVAATAVGAIPGALPPVIGWTAVRGTIDQEAMALFLIIFLWQVPHTLAIARLYRDDFARAGIRFLPVLEPDGRSTGRQVISHCLALIAVSLLPTLIGLAGTAYFLVALLLGAMFLTYGLRMALRQSAESARKLLFASLAYLPLLLIALWLGPNHTTFQEGLFFSKAAMVTFGGAYAVLPYVSQQAVESYGWLSAGQMMDGLGLAESTPGPLIMVLQFVGFLGGWNQPGCRPILADLH